MLPNTIHTDNEAPESNGCIRSCDTIEVKRAHLRSIIMELTDDECDLLWEEWRASYVR